MVKEVPYKVELPPKRKLHMASCGVVVDSKGNILLTRRARRLIYPHAWVVPGGHTDAGEFIVDGCLREIAEEVGIEVQHTSDSEYTFMGKEVLVRPLFMFESVWNRDIKEVSVPYNHHLIMFFEIRLQQDMSDIEPAL